MGNIKNLRDTYQDYKMCLEVLSKMKKYSLEYRIGYGFNIIPQEKSTSLDPNDVIYVSRNEHTNEVLNKALMKFANANIDDFSVIFEDLIKTEFNKSKKEFEEEYQKSL